MNREELKLTEYLHNIIEDNIALRRNNDVLWKQKLEYIGRLEKAIDYIQDNKLNTNKISEMLCGSEIIKLLEILKGDE